MPSQSTHTTNRGAGQITKNYAPFVWKIPNFETVYEKVVSGEQDILLYSWRFSRYSAPIHWLVHCHMTSNNETVSRQMP